MPPLDTIWGSSNVVSQGRAAWSTVSRTVGVPAKVVPPAPNRTDQTWDGSDELPSFDFHNR